MPLSVGHKLGPYEIVAPLGAGGIGEVYRALDMRLHREVAIKVSQERFSDSLRAGSPSGRSAKPSQHLPALRRGSRYLALGQRARGYDRHPDPAQSLCGRSS